MRMRRFAPRSTAAMLAVGFVVGVVTVPDQILAVPRPEHDTFAPHSGAGDDDEPCFVHASGDDDDPSFGLADRHLERSETSVSCRVPHPGSPEGVSRGRPCAGRAASPPASAGSTSGSRAGQVRSDPCLDRILAGFLARLRF